METTMKANAKNVNNQNANNQNANEQKVNTLNELLNQCQLEEKKKLKNRSSIYNKELLNNLSLQEQKNYRRKVHKLFKDLIKAFIDSLKMNNNEKYMIIDKFCKLIDNFYNLENLKAYVKNSKDEDLKITFEALLKYQNDINCKL